MEAALREVDELEPRFPRAGQETISVTATVARKEFGRILDLVEQGREVIVTRNGVVTAVMMPVARFDVLTADDYDAAAGAALLDTLTAEFDALLDRMQTPEARAARDWVFNASPEELGRILAAASPAKDRLRSIVGAAKRLRFLSPCLCLSA